MTEIARGSVADRPWGLTLGALGLRGLSGQLVLSDGKRYQIAFSGGAVVGASSPLATDAAVRIAMTGGLVSSTQVSDIARRTAGAPHRDEVEVIAEAIRLHPDQAMRLRRRVIAQRAARTFAVERGDFVIDDQVTLPIVPGSELDIRGVIFLGARSAMGEERLAAELARFGSWFRLKPEAVADLPQFGFGQSEGPVLDLLEAGAELADLERMGSEPHVVRAMVYALVSCSALDSDAPPRTQRAASRDLDRAASAAVTQQAARPPMRPQPPTQTPTFRQAQPVQPQPAQTFQASQPMRSSQPLPTQQQARGSQPLPTQQARASQPLPAQQARVSQPLPAQPARPPMQPPPPDDMDHATVRRGQPLDAPRTKPRSGGTVNPQQAAEVRNLIKKHLDLLKKKVDHYQLLGTHRDASADEIRKAYFALARQLHPDRLAALGIPDENKEAQRLFAEVNTAFGTLSDPVRREEYTSILKRGGAAAIAAEQQRAEEMAQRIVAAEEAFRRGEGALRRDQLQTAIAEFTRAIELNPEEMDYHALYAWSQFCASPDKMAIASSTRIALDRAINKSPRSVTPRFYLGRVERMLGRDNDALRHFQGVLQLQPHHSEAASEARVIEQRLANTRKR